jgi:hypothetical protein
MFTRVRDELGLHHGLLEGVSKVRSLRRCGGKVPDDLTTIAFKDVRESPGEKYFSLEP